MPNRLINEKSPYLLKHAHNPVDWYPWGEEAFEKARREDKPILLSIGYATCHWCSVMERESFENEEIARLINENFVPVKVDREERPDVDEVYMKAVQLMTGSGGWPLTVFLTPDLKPFYGGTYFPPRRRGGLPGFDEVLKAVAQTWRERRDEITKSAEELYSMVQRFYIHSKHANSLSTEPYDMAFDALVSIYDSSYGGFGNAPKFPMPVYVFFMHHYSWRRKNQIALSIASHTLARIATGGIHDHLAGGFHRYSTDRYWLIPHFEKMLYDNALLARAYLENYKLTRGGEMLETALKTLEWMLREMRSSEGGFYSAIDADTPEGEGFYYTWTREEIINILGEDVGRIICRYYGVSKEGNFEAGRNVLSIGWSLEALARDEGLKTEEIRRIIQEANKKLLEAREKRTKPAVDDKILTSWNGLAISALSLGYQATGEKRYLEAAEQAASFILNKLVGDSGLLRRYRDGEAAIPATLEDYSFFTAGLIDLYEADYDFKWLEKAIELTDEMINRLWDRDGGGFFFKEETEQGIPLIKECYDGVTPSGNSVAVINLIKLSEYTGNGEYIDKAEETLRVFWNTLSNDPLSHTYAVIGLDYLLSPRREVVVITLAEELEKYRKALAERYMPDTVSMLIERGREQDISRFFKLAEGKEMKGDRATAYVCRNFACKLPASTYEEFIKQLTEE